MANVGVRVKYEVVLNRSTCSSRPVHENQIGKSVETMLHSYPIWKISYKQRQYSYDGNLLEAKNRSMWHGEVKDEIGILRHDYIICVKLIEETLTVLSPMQKTFVQQRYFKRTPFKNIAEEMSVAERHLYRIRQDVIRIFAMAFGWL
jgi:hypothetical protein